MLSTKITGLEADMFDAQKQNSALEYQIQVLSQQNHQLQNRADELYAVAVHHEKSAYEKEMTIQMMQNTHGWRRLKKVVVPSPEQRLRARQLMRTARVTLRTKGMLGLADRSIRWLRGERRFYHPASSNLAPAPTATTTPFPSNIPDDPFSDYPQWIEEQEPDTDALARQTAEAERLTYKPVISILTPVYNTDRQMLIEMIESIRSQTYPYWELCLVDGGSQQTHVWETLQDYAQLDARIKVRHLEENLGISGNSNAALELVTGDFIALLDHDDTLAPFALFAVAHLLNTDQDLDFIYSDKDMITRDGTQRFHPLFKPDWSPEILLNINYLTHLCIIRSKLVREIGGFDMNANGAQDWALFLDVALRTNRIAHIPQILYHWRQHPLSVATGMISVKPYAANAQLHCIQRYLDARGLKGQPDFVDSSLIRVYWEIDTALPVTIILDVTTHLPVLQIEKLVRQYLFRSVYPNCDMVILNRTDDSKTLEVSHLLTSDSRIQILNFASNVSTGFARNRAVEKANGEVYVFLSADLISDNDDVIHELVSWAQHPEIGAVTGHLMQPDGTLAHAGYILNLDGVVGSIGPGYQRYADTLCGFFIWYRNLSAVSGDCLAIRRQQFQLAGGFDEDYKNAGSDVDLCLRLRKQLVRHLCTPFAEFRYRQPISTTWAGTAEDTERLRAAHSGMFDTGDPYYNVNLSTDFVIPHLRIASHPGTKAETTVSKSGGTWGLYSAEAEYFAHTYDFDHSLLRASTQIHENNPGALDIKSITWFIPSFTNAFYGGIHTILRFASYFHTVHGVENRFVVVSEDAKSIAKAIRAAFPELASAKVDAILTIDDVKHLPPTDAGVCTLWTTAYALLRFNQTKRKFYFIQDMEPLFYPAGTTSGLTEASYRFGFYGLINTPGLEVIYERDYYGHAASFSPAINTSVFYPPAELQPAKPPYRVFFYGRPGHLRNAFELGSVALRKLKRSMGNDVEIVAAGAEWNPADYELGGIVENLGILKYEATGDLYRTCHAGLVMMFTRHPSYLPIELMACNSLVVTNYNAYTSWLLKDRVNCLLTEASATSIAETLELGLRDDQLRQEVTHTAGAMVVNERTDWQAEMENIFTYMCAPKDKPDRV